MTLRKTLSAIAASAAVSSAATAVLFSALPAPAAVVAPGGASSPPSLASIYSREARTAREVTQIAEDVKALKTRGADTARLVARIDDRVSGGSRVSFGRSPYELLVGLYSACVDNADCRVGP